MSGSLAAATSRGNRNMILLHRSSSRRPNDTLEQHNFYNTCMLPSHAMGDATCKLLQCCCCFRNSSRTTKQEQRIQCGCTGLHSIAEQVPNRCESSYVTVITWLLLVWELLYILHNGAAFVRGWFSSFRELGSLVCRSQLPVRWCYIVGNHGLAVASGDAERQWLWLQAIAAVLPVLAPVPTQWVPASRVTSFDGHLLNVSCASYVGDEN